MAQLLVVDDERSLREFLQILLERDGHHVMTAKDVQGALAACRAQELDLVFADLKLPDGSGMEVLQYLRDHCPDVQFIMMTAYATAENAVEAMRMGAYDYQIKPFKVDEVRALTQKALEKVELIRENRALVAQLKERGAGTRLVGNSPKMAELRKMVERVAARYRANILIEGESGTGKELVARAIHESSPRAQGPFVAVNCGAIPGSLIEAELFGHAAGSFTGAVRDRAGLFEAAGGGTLLLDEIGELPPPMQVKLLRALQERSIRRVGEDKERAIDTHIIASTNRDLESMVAEGTFREDLFYRLNVVRIRVPPLRERTEDIPRLARSFAFRYAAELGITIEGIAPAAMRSLSHCPFPGNVRQLENVIERAVTLATGQVIGLQDLSEDVRAERATTPADLLAFPEAGIGLEQVLDLIERRFLEEALRRADGVKKRAAELLGLTFRSLRYRVQKLGLNGDEDPGNGDDEGSP